MGEAIFGIIILWHILILRSVRGVQFLEEHPELQNRKTYVAGGEIFLALSMLRSPYELNLYEQDGNFFEYWYCGGLGEPEEYCNYIVWDKYGEYMEELRRLGYGEVPYSNYSLFYFRRISSFPSYF